MTDVETVTIDRRYRGPLRSANGGYACGLLGSRVGAGAQVTLRLPPPLERPLTIRRDGERLVLEDGDLLVAECFVCGAREDGSGLGIRPGPVPGRAGLRAALVATTWTAHDVSPEVIWAAIDCPGAYASGDPGRGEVVLGRMTARIDRLPDEGEPCVVVGWPLGEDGRKLFAGTALYGRDGTPLAVARQVWILPR